MEQDEAVAAFPSSPATIAAGQSVNVTIQSQEPSTGQASDFSFYSGYIVATPRGQDVVPVRIPYAGMKGDFAQLPILDKDSGFPALLVCNLTADKAGLVKKGYKIDKANGGPYIYVRLGSHTPDLSVQHIPGWVDGEVYVNRKATTATKVRDYRILIAGRRKLSQGVYPIDLEVYEVGVLKV
ncbi:hypothetical protein BGX34_006543 [Mortierella sp. NVP85]|nr:hypothetical protein BGX34_006543 [Mortierella sp. NVP85]